MEMQGTSEDPEIASMVMFNQSGASSCVIS